MTPSGQILFRAEAGAACLSIRYHGLVLGAYLWEITLHVVPVSGRHQLAGAKRNAQAVSWARAVLGGPLQGGTEAITGRTVFEQASTSRLRNDLA